MHVEQVPPRGPRHTLSSRAMNGVVPCESDTADGEKGSPGLNSDAMPEELPTPPASVSEPLSFLALSCPHRKQGWMNLHYQEKGKVVVKGNAHYLEENHPFLL